MAWIQYVNAIFLRRYFRRKGQRKQQKSCIRTYNQRVAIKWFPLQLFLKAVNGENGQYHAKKEISSQENRTSLPVYQLLSKRNIFSPKTLLLLSPCWANRDVIPAMISAMSNTRYTGGFMSKQGIRALVYVSLVSAMIWGATGYLLVTAVHVL